MKDYFIYSNISQKNLYYIQLKKNYYEEIGIQYIATQKVIKSYPVTVRLDLLLLCDLLGMCRRVSKNSQEGGLKI